MEDNKEAVQDAVVGFAGDAPPDEQQTGLVEDEFKDMEVDNETEPINGEKPVESATDPEPSPIITNSQVPGNNQVSQVEENPSSVNAIAKELCSASVALTRSSTGEEKCEEVNSEVQEVLSSADNGSREKELEKDSTPVGDVQKEEEMEGDFEGVEVAAKNGNEKPNAVSSETEVAKEINELKNEPNIKTASKSFLLNADDATGDESGTDEDQAAFMKELETFHRERCLEFKPPKFYQEPLNCLK